MKNIIGIVCVCAAALLLLPSGPSGPEPVDPSDEVSRAFDVSEQLWRAAQGSLADRLDSGEITSEAAATEWFGEANRQARKQAFKPLLEVEYSAFGGENWTAKKQSEFIRKYVR